MSAREARPSDDALSDAVWPKPRHPRGLAQVLAAARRLPAWLGEASLAFGALAQGITSSARRRQALAWVAAQPGPRRSDWLLACSLLAFRGTCMASMEQLGVRDLAALRARTTIEGVERLEGTTQLGGVLLLGFHLGPYVDPVVLRSHGYRATVAVRTQRRHGSHDPTSWWLHPPEDLVLFPNPTWRLRALYELRRRLLAGRTVYLAADGLHGTEAFRIDLPGAPLVLRTGWMILRRSTGATTFPLLSRREGRRIVVTIHPPLPDPAPDLSDDRAACRARLTPLLEDYVRRFPAQCFSLALQPAWNRSPAPGTLPAP